jgi:hypothetical protein
VAAGGLAGASHPQTQAVPPSGPARLASVSSGFEEGAAGGLSDEQLAILLQDELFLQELQQHPDFAQVRCQDCRGCRMYRKRTASLRHIDELFHLKCACAVKVYKPPAGLRAGRG